MRLYQSSKYQAISDFYIQGPTKQHTAEVEIIRYQVLIPVTEVQVSKLFTNHRKPREWPFVALKQNANFSCKV